MTIIVITNSFDREKVSKLGKQQTETRRGSQDVTENYERTSRFLLKLSRAVHFH